MQRVRRVLLLAALMILGTCNVSAATRVQVMNNYDFYDSVSDLYEFDDNVIRACSEDDTIVYSRLIVMTEKKFAGFNYDGIIEAVSNGTDVYVIQFDTMENAQKAYDDLSKDVSVTVEFDVCRDWLSAVDDEELVGLNSVESFDAFESGDFEETATHLTWGASTMNTDSYASYLNKTSHSQIIVAVVDSGINKSHTMFQNKLVSGKDYIDGDTNPNDESGHGTHVAGTIADITKDLSFVKIMPVRVLGPDGGSGTSVGNGIRYAADKGAKVINLSLGNDNACDSYVDNSVKYAISKGCTVVVAAGNKNTLVKTGKTCPAHMTDCITVASIDYNKSKAASSNYGDAIDTAAPGVGITSAWIGSSTATNTIGGTSMATPHVSAVVAMMRTQYGSLSTSKMHTLIKRASTNIGSATYFGYGLIDMKNLMKDMSALSIKLENTSYKYTGSAIKPSVSVKYNSVSLYNDIDYTLTYSNNTKVGKASVKITGKGAYTGSVTKTFTIRPKGTSISSITPGKGQFKAKWKTVTTQTTGYEFRISRQSDMSESKTFVIDDNTIGYKTVKNLKSGKTYYCQVRTYKTVSGIKYYSSWSSTVSVKPN